MTVWDKMAIFDTTAKNSVLERSVPGTDLKYEKKMKKFDLVRMLFQNLKIPFGLMSAECEDESPSRKF